MLVCLTAVVTVALGWSIAALPAEANHKSIAERARAIAARDIYQKELVKSQAPQSRSPMWRLKSGGDPQKPPDGAVARIVLYLAIGLASGLILIWLIGWLIHRRQRTTSPGDDALVSREDPGGTLPSLRAVERLATSGDHCAAVRGLLHLAVSFLSSKRRFEVSEASTGRELERLLPRNEDEKATLALLVKTVERSLFGDMPVDQRTYERCRKAFARMLA